MAATVQIVEKNGAGATATDKTSGTIRFKSADEAAADTANRINIPSSSSVFSYEKWLRANVTVAPSVDLQNLVFYTDGANGFGTGVDLWAKAVTSYATPTQPSDSSGFSDAFGYDSGSPLDLGAGPHTGTGEKGDHAVLALEVASTATQGQTSSETLTFQFDET